MRYVHVVSVIGLLGLAPLSANAAHPRTCVEEADEHGAFRPVSPPGSGGGIPFDPSPLPLPGPGPGPIPGGGGTGQFTSCVLKTGAGSYQGIGFTEGQATAAARDQCLQVESVLACDAG